MSNKIKISSNTKWEKMNAYSRAIKCGNRIVITGTTSVNEKGNVIGRGSVYEQTVYIFQKFSKYLKQLGADLNDVIINRVYLTDITKWQEVGKAHSEIFGEIKPCLTLIGVSNLVLPELLVEIECEAYVNN